MTLTNKTSTLSVLMVGLGLGLSGCGQGFTAGTANGVNSTSSNSSTAVGGVSDPAGAAFKSLSIDGTVSGGSDTKTQVISIDKTNKMLVARLPLPLGSLGGIGLGSLPFNEIPGATIGVEPTASGGSALTIKIPLATFMKGLPSLPMMRLPNGDALPVIPGGELPGLALENSNVGLPMTVFLAPSVLAIYVESPVNPYIGLTLPIRNASRTRTWGYFSSVPAKTTFKGGFFMSLAMPDDIARIIDGVI